MHHIATPKKTSKWNPSVDGRNSEMANLQMDFTINLWDFYDYRRVISLIWRFPKMGVPPNQFLYPFGKTDEQPDMMI